MQIVKRSPILVRPLGFEITRDMTQTMSFMVGALLISTGLCEILVPSFMELNLSILHSVLIGAVGASLIYNGFKENSRAAYLTCLISGVAFAILSLVGFIFGERTNAFVRFDRNEDYLLDLPGLNPMGAFDHGVHAVIAVVLLLGALDWYRHHKNDSLTSSDTPAI